MSSISFVSGNSISMTQSNGGLSFPRPPIQYSWIYIDSLSSDPGVTTFYCPSCYDANDSTVFLNNNYDANDYQDENVAVQDAYFMYHIFYSSGI